MRLDAEVFPRPCLFGVSERGPAMKSERTRARLAGTAVVPAHCLGSATADRTKVTTLFGHVKGVGPHLARVFDAEPVETDFKLPPRLQDRPPAPRHRLGHDGRPTHRPRRGVRWRPKAGHRANKTNKRRATRISWSGGTVPPREKNSNWIASRSISAATSGTPQACVLDLWTVHEERLFMAAIRNRQ